MAETLPVTISRGQTTARFVLRAASPAAIAAGDAAGVQLPEKINRLNTSGGRSAMKLGPDEWLLLAQDADAAAIAASLATALTGHVASVVDISHRQTGIAIGGPQVVAILNCAVPLDLSLKAFPVGMATRTIFEKAEIVLFRSASDQFGIEVWRSFAPYVEGLLEKFSGEISGA